MDILLRGEEYHTAKTIGAIYTLFSYKNNVYKNMSLKIAKN
jgi:hypothetical protein